MTLRLRRSRAGGHLGWREPEDLSEQSSPLGGPPTAASSRAQAPGLTYVCLETEVTVLSQLPPPQRLSWAELCPPNLGPHADVLSPSAWEVTVFVVRVFKEVIKVKRGH